MTQADLGRANGHVDGEFDALRARLADPETARQLTAIVDKLDVIHMGVEAADGLLRRGETLMDNTRDALGEAKHAVDPEGLLALGRVVALAPKLVAGLEKLSPALESKSLETLGDPALVDALAGLAKHTPLLTFAAEAATGFLERSEVVIDNLADGVAEVRGLADGGSRDVLGLVSQLGALLPAVQTLLAQVQPLIEAGSLESLAKSKILAPEMVDTVARVGDALHATRISHAENPTSLGLFGMLKALRDPDAKRGLGFLATFLKEFGRQMR